MTIRSSCKSPAAVAALFCAAALSAPAFAADSLGEPGRGSGKKNPLNNVYFGEQHLHTQDSPDAFAMGTRNTQDDAYRFCEGEAVEKSTGGKNNMVKKQTPYDWCAVTDHAYLLGMLPQTLDSKSPLSKSEIAKLIAKGDSKSMDAAFGLIMQAG